MFTKRLNVKVWVAVLLLAITAFGVGKVVAQSGDMDRKFETYLQVLDIVKNDYVNKDLDDQKLVYGSIRGLLESLDDPYTRFMEPKSYKEMKMRMSGSYSGIGIYIGIKNNTLAVISPIVDTPGKKAGLHSGDYILKIDGKDTKDMALEEAVSLIRGPQGTKVKLNIIRVGWKEPKDFDITRAKIEIKSVVRKEYEGLAYIKINTFENLNTSTEFEKALRLSKDDPGLIIDVRDNGGGLLQNAIDIGSMFIASGTIVKTVDREKREESLDSSGRVLWTKPVVMLINEGSASASEILAGALRDHKIATLIGTRSFGKASVQNVRQLNDGSAVLLTIAKYLTPNGDYIMKKGISPEVDVQLPTREAEAVLEQALPEEEKDVQLQKAIQVLKSKIQASETPTGL
jgi:carboxyl-terminal processing protease